MEADKVIAEYNGLWTVERNCRISKETLDISLMSHFTPRRIEVHICICIVAYKVFHPDNLH